MWLRIISWGTIGLYLLFVLADWAWGDERPAPTADAPMPPKVSVIVCRVKPIDGPPDQNAKYTGHEGLEWDYIDSMLHCRLYEIDLYDPSEAKGAEARPFNQHACQAAAISIIRAWDQAHTSSKYRAWRAGCPAPIIDRRTGRIIAWKMPDCGHRDTVICDGPAQI